MSNPYKDLDSKAFWKPSVADQSMFEICNLWDPKFNIKKSDRIATFGSCFAQYIGNALDSKGYCWLRTEKPPVGLSSKSCERYNYDRFSARTGNIYTATLLKQWTSWAIGDTEVPDEVWKDGNRFFDPMRPTVEPNGFNSADEVRLSLAETISAFRESIRRADYFVFTLGLTESWVNVEGGYEYPMCPGTAAGEYNPDNHKFVDLQFQEIISSLNEAVKMMRSINPELKFILTVSPVPLTATYTNKHVVVATMAAKSKLRAVASQLSENRRYIDYFPSYEFINSPVYKGAFFNPNQRSVNQHGVQFVMENFFKCLHSKFGSEIEMSSYSAPASTLTESSCDEELLGAFGK